jgi:hypothetical protein
VVTLPAGQQQVLDRIESDLEGCEPRLRSMFAIFTRLTRDDGAPRTESLQPRARRWTWPGSGLTERLRAIVAVLLLLGLVAFFVLMAISRPVTRGCPPTAAPVRPASCQSAPMPVGRM